MARHLVDGSTHRCYVWLLNCLLPISETQRLDDLDVSVSGPGKAALQGHEQVPNLPAHLASSVISAMRKPRVALAMPAHNAVTKVVTVKLRATRNPLVKY